MIQKIFPKLLIGVFLSQVLLSPGSSDAYDFSYDHAQKKLAPPVTVAVVPFSETRTPSVNALMDRLSKELKSKGRFRVLESEKTDEILSYYLNYVNKNTEDSKPELEISEARQAILSGNFGGAAKLLATAETKIRQRENKGGSNEGLYQVHLLKAKVHYAQGQQGQVQSDYDQVVRVHPDLELDASLYSNWERKALDKAKQGIETSRNASLKIDATPEGSEVFLNGVHRGITPLTIPKIPAGNYVVEIKTVNHEKFVQSVRVAPNETTRVKATLVRNGTGGAVREVTIRPSLYKSDVEISKMISTLGYHLGVDKIVLVADKKEQGIDSVVYRAGDTQLGAVQKLFQFPLTTGGSGKGGVSSLASTLRDEVKTDVLKNPAKYANQSVGSLDLLHQRRKPFYKKPLFWVITAAAAGVGGALGAILGAGGAAAGGVVIGL